MAKSSRSYKSAKRAKELLRQKKREEKRLRRLNKDKEPAETDTLTPSETEPESKPEDAV